MTVNKIELIGISVSIIAMALVLWLLRIEDATVVLNTAALPEQSASVYVADSDRPEAALADAVVEAYDEGSNKIDKLIIDDVLLGSGKTATAGSKLTVHYIGTFRSGQQFDNSYERGEPFTFTLGEGKVIEGWDNGLVGMKEGGQRILVVPSELGYGSGGFGPIPPNATLVFAIELLAFQE